MSFEITTAFVQQYSGNVMLLVQQQGSRLRETVMNQDVVGKNAYFDQIGATEAQQVSNRHGDSPLVSTPHRRRRVSLVDYDWGDLVDRLDLVKTLIDPTNPYAVNASWAMGRKIDDIIISAIYASAATGEDGSTSVVFPAANEIAVNDHTYDSGSGDVGLTVGKLIFAREKLDAAEVPEEEGKWIIHSAKQLSNMLASVEVQSADYNAVKALVRGDVETYMGFTFRRSERLPLSSGDRRVPVYTSTGMGLAVGSDVVAQIAPRADKRFSTYVYFQMSFGATRIEEEKVVSILCNE